MVAKRLSTRLAEGSRSMSERQIGYKDFIIDSLAKEIAQLKVDNAELRFNIELLTQEITKLKAEKEKEIETPESV